MKSVLISIQPKWCELIASGKKTIEVRKTAPKEVPFKAYIYCTKVRKPSDFMTKSEQFGYVNAPEYVFCNRDNRYNANGKVIGEFVCDRIEHYYANERGWYAYPQDETCLLCDEIAHYGKQKRLFGWHISELKIYDEPRDVKFKSHKVIRGYHKKDEKSEIFNDKIESLKHSNRVELKIITKAPVSWCYVN